MIFIDNTNFELTMILEIDVVIIILEIDVVTIILN